MSAASSAGEHLYSLLVTGHRQEAHELVVGNRSLVNSEVKPGRPLLHEAVLWGGPDVVEWLLRHGANVNSKDSKGKTPKEICEQRAISHKLEDWVAVFGSRVVAPDLDGLSDFSAKCQVCRDDGHLGLGPDDFFELPCKHRIHKSCMKNHIKGILNDRTRLLANLTCQYVPDGKVAKCNFNLNTPGHMRYFIHLFRDEPFVFDRLQQYLTDGADFIARCTKPTCGDGVYMDLTPGSVEYRNLLCRCGHQFCGKCIAGPHPGKTCEEAVAEAARQPGTAVAERNQVFCEQFRQKKMRPCPLQCRHLGFDKAPKDEHSASCDHVSCLCGHEFCWDCGADRRVIIAHDCRWHKPGCKFYTARESIKEPPRREPKCPQCQATPGGGACQWPQKDGWPEAFLPPVPSTGALIAGQGRALLEQVFRELPSGPRASTGNDERLNWHPSQNMFNNFRELALESRWLDPQLFLLVICLIFVMCFL